MNKFSVITTLLVASISVLEAAKFPSDVPKCKPGDSQCIKDSAAIVLSQHPEGIPGINLLSLDPISIDKIDIANGEGPVNLKLFFNNAKLYGAKDAVIKKISGFTNDPTGQNELTMMFPRLELISPYAMDGRVLILPVQGKGDSNLTLLNSESVIRFKGTPVSKNGKVYMQTDNNLKFTVQPKKMIVSFGNMFNGDPVLGPTTNAFLNENWEDIYRELKPSVEAAFGKVIETLINNVFASLQYKNLFLAE